MRGVDVCYVYHPLGGRGEALSCWIACTSEESRKVDGTLGQVFRECVEFGADSGRRP